MMMTFDQSLAYLSAALRFGIKLGLHRMNRLMELLHHPEYGLRYIHIAGTNGKGSVSCYCAAILASAGYRTGWYTSPFLQRFSERIRILDGRAGLAKLEQDESYGEISRSGFAEIMTEIKAAVDIMLAEGLEHPTEFELITAAAFLHFKRAACDLVVLETGLGGRLDSTNIIEKPLCTIITALGYDHMDRLGYTMAEIAAEKAGIIKPDCPVYLYDPAAALDSSDARDALTVIRSRCEKVAAPLTLVRQEDQFLLSYDWHGQRFHDRALDLDLVTTLLGVFQPMNAALAIRACRDLASPDCLKEGIQRARWPGRLEICRFDPPGQPPVLLDGAHNPQGCQALGEALDRLLPRQSVVFLTGMMADKDYPVMLKAVLCRSGYETAAVICICPHNPRALSAQDLAAQVRIALKKDGELPNNDPGYSRPDVPIAADTCAEQRNKDPENLNELPATALSGYNRSDIASEHAAGEIVHAFEDPIEGARFALDMAKRQGMPLCAFGSLFMVGDVRSLLLQA